MSLTVYPQNFPPATTPIVDTSTGVPTQFGRFLLLAFFNRTGQQQGIVTQVATGLTAAGSTRADALALAADWNEVDTTPANSGVSIPVALQPGQMIVVFNGGANALKVYPPSAAKIDGGAAGAAYSLAAGKMQVFFMFSPTQFRSMQLG
jgi:hypothetical protein